MTTDNQLPVRTETGQPQSPVHRPCALCWNPSKDRPAEPMNALILRSLPVRLLDDDGDGYGGVPFVSLDEAVRALTTDRERYERAALERPSA